MKLYLGKFKNHENLELELPDTGLVRIAGRSGTGKSSILGAIVWCLFNKGTNIVTWNEKTTKVDFEGFGINASRVKNPNNFSCNGIGGPLAQDEVERILGMNKLEFDISSYVSQGQRSSLINLSPSEQLALINVLAFKDKNPQEAKERISEYLKAAAVSIEAGNNEMAILQERLNGLQENIANLTNSLPSTPIDVNAILEQITVLELEMEEKRKRAAAVQAELNNIIKEINSPARKASDEARSFLKHVDSEIADLELEVSRPENAKVVFSEKDYQDKILSLTTASFKFKQEHEKLKKLQRTTIDISAVENMIRTYLQEINTITGFGGLTLEEADLSEKLLSLKIQAEGCLSSVESRKLAASSEEQEMLRNKLTALASQITESNVAADKLRNEYEKNTQHNNKVSNLHARLSDLRSKKDAAIRILGSAPGAPLEDLRQRENELKIEFGDIVSDGSMMRKDQNLLKEKIEEDGKRQLVLSKIKALQERLDTTVAAMAQKTKEQDHTIRMFSEGKKLESLWSKAALDVIDSTVGELNFRASYWLDILLEGKVQAELKTTKKIKSKDQIVDSLNLEIMYKGQILERVSEELSGGQYSRVVLAYQLALSDLLNSPILMLDEALRGNDTETIEICLEAIKTISDRKLVIVVEHNIPSHYFDKEINLADI
jgi:DNA repair exonuclease SbcCD ATPase subunit